MAGLGREINKSDACAFFRFRQPHNLRGGFDALPRAGQLKANAWEVVIYYKGVGCGNGHARLTYVEDNTAIGSAELDLRGRGRSGALLKAAVALGIKRLNRRISFGAGR